MLIIRVLHAEMLKLKRTLAFRMIFVAPLLVATLQFFVIWNQRRPGANFNLWEMISRASLSVWAVFMLPLLITLASDDSAWLNQCLQRAGFKVSAITPKQRTLKEFFLSITGGNNHA